MSHTVTATRPPDAASHTKRTRFEGARDVDVSQGAAADEFPPGFAEFAVARARGIAIARACSASGTSRRDQVAPINDATCEEGC